MKGRMSEGDAPAAGMSLNSRRVKGSSIHRGAMPVSPGLTAERVVCLNRTRVLGESFDDGGIEDKTEH